MTNLEQQLSVGFVTELEILKKTTDKQFELSIIPFLEIFDTKEYVDLMLKVYIYIVFEITKVIKILIFFSFRN